MVGEVGWGWLRWDRLENIEGVFNENITHMWGGGLGQVAKLGWGRLG